LSTYRKFWYLNLPLHMTREEIFMREAVMLSEKGMIAEAGGPFGCVVVRGEEIVGRGWNQVLAMNDPTAHAEIIAIREACRRLESFHLAGCELFSSCEPCPMCLGAVYWAQIKTVYFANTRHDAAAIGFNDSFIYEELNCAHDARTVRMIACGREEAIRVFSLWQQKGNRILY